MSTTVLFWIMGWTEAALSVLDSFLSMLEDNWSEGSTPIIADVTDYRSLDLANKEYVLLEIIEEVERHYGLGGSQYMKTVTVAIILSTGVSDLRARQMLEECRKIFRTKDNWVSSFQNFKISRNVNRSNKERKVYSYDFVVTAIKTESV